MRRTVDLLDASRMTANTSRETSRRVSEYFGDSGPFSYRKVRKILPVLLSGNVPFEVAVAGIRATKFDLARKCNLDVATLVASCDVFRERNFYPIKAIQYAVDQKFAISLRPETVVSIDRVPNLIFLQPRKNPTLWAYNPSFMRRILEDAYIPDYFEKARFWLLDTEAKAKENREFNLVDLQSVETMSDREFNRRVAALRSAWRLYLANPRPSRPRPEQIDDKGQFDFFDGE